jgi:hypothetical protein
MAAGGDATRKRQRPSAGGDAGDKSKKRKSSSKRGDARSEGAEGDDGGRASSGPTVGQLTSGIANKLVRSELYQKLKHKKEVRHLRLSSREEVRRLMTAAYDACNPGATLAPAPHCRKRRRQSE